LFVLIILVFGKLPGEQFGGLLRRQSGEESGKSPGLLSGQLLGEFSGEELSELPGDLRGPLFCRLLRRLSGESLRK
jgi:hypothetical protein